jgi:hypothetical protein
MTAATIVDWIEQHKRSGEPLVLSEPTKTWVDRLWHAVIDPEVSEADWAAVDAAFCDYLDRLADQREARAAAAAAVVLASWLEDESWPRCKCCGRPICPHCDDRRHRV